jgi:hypothetical protein
MEMNLNGLLAVMTCFGQEAASLQVQVPLVE